jgi:hypothetical protein
MKKLTTCLLSILMFSVLLCSPMPAVASTDLDDLSQATLISESTEINDGLLTSTKVYLFPDGTELIDELIVSAFLPLSASGTDTVTRIKTISGRGSVSLTASFEWGVGTLLGLPTSRVKCTSASRTSAPATNFVASMGSVNYDSTWTYIGNTTASVTYNLYMSSNPSLSSSGTLKIKCTDTGSISDSGF